ncbi:MAG TPA: TonB family protein [Ramlibacter sp.]|nr:TonB family protein [Ramlibacter sp.]
MNKLTFADALPPMRSSGFADALLPAGQDTPNAPRFSRNALIAGSVVAFHVLALWALQSGLLMRAVEIVVPAEILSEIITPPVPKIEPQPVPKPPEPVKQPVVKKVEPHLPRPPMPVALADPTPAPNAPTGVIAPQPPAPPIAAPVAATPTPPTPAKVELPSSDADYLQNPKPAYPPASKRLGEQGKVLVRVLIGVDGLAQKAEIRQSSGFDRLDQAALTTVQKWRYVPGKRAGVAEAMWFNVPVNFVLE